MASRRTLQEVADELGVHYSYVSRLRNGERTPSARVLDELHQVYGVPLVDLMAARRSGPEAFGALMREQVFESAAA